MILVILTLIPRTISITDSNQRKPIPTIGYHRNTCVFVRKGRAVIKHTGKKRE